MTRATPTIHLVRRNEGPTRVSLCGLKARAGGPREGEDPPAVWAVNAVEGVTCGDCLEKAKSNG